MPNFRTCLTLLTLAIATAAPAVQAKAQGVKYGANDSDANVTSILGPISIRPVFSRTGSVFESAIGSAIGTDAVSEAGVSQPDPLSIVQSRQRLQRADTSRADQAVERFSTLMGRQPKPDPREWSGSGTGVR